MTLGRAARIGLSDAPPPAPSPTAKILRLAGPWTVRLMTKDGRELEAPWYARRTELPARWKVEGPGEWYVAFAMIVHADGHVLWSLSVNTYLFDGDSFELRA